MFVISVIDDEAHFTWGYFRVQLACALRVALCRSTSGYVDEDLTRKFTAREESYHMQAKT